VSDKQYWSCTVHKRQLAKLCHTFSTSWQYNVTVVFFCLGKLTTLRLCKVSATFSFRDSFRRTRTKYNLSTSGRPQGIGETFTLRCFWLAFHYACANRLSPDPTGLTVIKLDVRDVQNLIRPTKTLCVPLNFCTGQEPQALVQCVISDGKSIVTQNGRST